LNDPARYANFAICKKNFRNSKPNLLGTILYDLSRELIWEIVWKMQLLGMKPNLLGLSFLWNYGLDRLGESVKHGFGTVT
jgi:hypothetical protein